MQVGPSIFLRVSSVLAAVGLVANVASAQLIVPTAQERRLSCSAYVADLFDEATDGDNDAAADFTLFDSAISARAELDTGLGSGGGIQQSDIFPTSISATGSAFATGESWDLDAFADGSGLSRMYVTFTLTADSNYRLQGSIAAYDSGSAEINLLEGAISIYNELAFGPADEIPINRSGSLTAGEHTLRIDASGSAFGDSFFSDYAFSEYDITFRVGAPGAGGEVPDGDDVPGGPPLMAQRLAGGNIRLTWGSSCRIDDSDYGIYQGDLDAPQILGPVQCSTGGLLEYDVTPTYEQAYFLVVPNDGVTEGSYGDDGNGEERFPSTSPCFAQSLGAPVCP